MSAGTTIIFNEGISPAPPPASPETEQTPLSQLPEQLPQFKVPPHPSLQVPQLYPKKEQLDGAQKIKVNKSFRLFPKLEL